MSARRRLKGQVSSKPIREDQSDRCEDTQTTSTKPAEKSPKSKWRAAFGILKYLLLLVIVPPIMNYAALQREIAELKPTEGELYDVGWGRKMYLMCRGKGPPTVVMDAPTGMTSDIWALVWPKIATQARVCIYDRAGLGFSERPLENSTVITEQGQATKILQHSRWQPFTAESMVDDLHRLLMISSQQPRPLILVGAELGALVAQFFTLMFEGDVLGLVLLNPLPENLFQNDQQFFWSRYWFGQLIPSYQSMQLGAALGMIRVGLLLGLLKQPLSAAHLDDVVVRRQKHLLCHPRHLSSVVDEHHFINETFSQMRTLRLLRSLPSNVSVTVMTGNYYDQQLPSSLNKVWAKAEQDLITQGFPMAQHIVVNTADRHMPLTAPEAIIEQVLKQVRHWRLKQPAAA